MTRVVLVVLLAVPLAAQSVADPSPHRVSFVTVDGVRVPFLDWGGDGPCLVFIAGNGNSAHVFDDFAPRFVDRFKVLAVTRTGFGESDQPERDGYDLASRVAHIRAALDSANIAKAVLIGHSLGGDEITAFANAYPQRTAALVYLDAAIDHAAAMQTLGGLAAALPTPPNDTPDERSSPEKLRQFLRRITGVEYPLGEVLALTVVGPKGLLRTRAAPRVSAAIAAATVPPEFSRLTAKILALYSDSSAAEAFPWLDKNSPELSRASSTFDTQLRPMLLRERERFAQAAAHAEIVTYPAHHYQFLSQPADTERRIRAFLSANAVR
jgi:non-heme chloroperoxidase